MYTVSDFRRGLAIIVDDQPWYVVEYSHFKMGRGRANIRTKLKHIKTGQVIERVFSSNDSFRPPDLERRTMQFLYKSDNEYIFMDTKTYDQVHILGESIEDTRLYLLDNQDYIILFLDNQAINIDLPASVILEVVETEPAVRGDTVSNVTKPATLKSGIEVKVPLFVKIGDKVKVDTRSGAYLERAN
jgi:elongation factor P